MECMEMENLTLEQEREKERELRFERQKKAMKRIVEVDKKFNWGENNHKLFPNKEALPPIKKKKNKIDFD